MQLFADLSSFVRKRKLLATAVIGALVLAVGAVAISVSSAPRAASPQFDCSALEQASAADAASLAAGCDASVEVVDARTP